MVEEMHVQHGVHAWHGVEGIHVHGMHGCVWPSEAKHVYMSQCVCTSACVALHICMGQLDGLVGEVRACTCARARPHARVCGPVGMCAGHAIGMCMRGMLYRGPA